MLSRRTALVTIVVSASLVAGCADHTGSGQAGSPSQSGSISNTADRKAEAQRDAADRLTTFRPPPGAQQLPGRPAGATTLSEPGGSGLYTATATSWWQASGEPQAVLKSLALPSGASPGNSSSTQGPNGDTYTIVLRWPRQDLLVERTIDVTAARVDGTTILRVAASTVWIPERDPATLVPAGVRSVVVSFQPSQIGPNSEPYGPVTVRGPAQVAAVVNEVATLHLRWDLGRKR